MSLASDAHPSASAGGEGAHELPLPGPSASTGGEGAEAVPPGGRSAAVADLEGQREFFLRSLRDLEAEHAAGDIDDVDYRALRDDYTSRAAEVLRRLGDLRTGAAAGEVRATVPGSRRVPTGQAVAGPAPVGGGRAGGARSQLGARFLGARRSPGGAETASPGGAETASPGGAETASPGGAETASPGGAETASSGGAETAPPRAVGRRRPWTRTQKALLVAAAVALAAGAGWQVGRGSSPRLSGQTITGQTLGAQAVSQLLVQGQQAAAKNPVQALKDFNRVLAVYPDQPQALTDEGWVLAQGGLLSQARVFLEHAEQSDPGYALPHAYLGIVLGDQGDYQGAVDQLQYFLGHSPEPALVAQARAALAVAQHDLKATAPKTSGG